METLITGRRCHIENSRRVLASLWRMIPPWLLLLLTVTLVVLPLAALIYGSVRTASPGLPGTWTLRYLEDVYVGLFTGGSWQSATINSVILAIPVMILSMFLGVSISWILARTDIPYKRFFEVVFLVPMFYSGLCGLIGWTCLAAPRSGYINLIWTSMTGSSEALVNIYSFGGMVWVMTLFFLPYAYILNIDTFKTMDPSLEEAAAVSGASMGRSFRSITLPLMLPSTLAASLFIFTLAMEQFAIPGFLGSHIRYSTLAYSIWYRTTDYPADLSAAASGGTILLFMSAIGLLLYRRVTKQKGKFVTITARGYKPAAIKTGRMRPVLVVYCVTIFMLVCVVPIVSVILRALMSVRTIGVDFLSLNLTNFVQVFTTTYFLNSLKNSFVLSLSAAVLIVILGMTISLWVVRRKSRPITMVDYLVSLPIAIPGTVFGIGMLWAYIRTPLYMTLTILLLAFVARNLVYGVRMMGAGLMKTDPALEEAGLVSGASTFGVFWHINLPLLRPVATSLALLIFLIVMREISCSVMLYGPKTGTLPIVTWTNLNEGFYGVASALAVVQMVIVGIVVVVARYVLGIEVKTSSTH